MEEGRWTREGKVRKGGGIRKLGDKKGLLCIINIAYNVQQTSTSSLQTHKMEGGWVCMWCKKLSKIMYKKTHSNAIKIFTVLKNKYVFKIGRYIKIAIHILPIVLLSQNWRFFKILIEGMYITVIVISFKMRRFKTNLSVQKILSLYLNWVCI